MRTYAAKKWSLQRDDQLSLSARGNPQMKTKVSFLGIPLGLNPPLTFFKHSPSHGWCCCFRCCCCCWCWCYKCCRNHDLQSFNSLPDVLVCHYKMWCLKASLNCKIGVHNSLYFCKQSRLKDCWVLFKNAYLNVFRTVFPTFFGSRFLKNWLAHLVMIYYWI